MAASLILLCFSALIASGVGLEFLNGPGCPEPFGEQAYPHPEACDRFFLCINGTVTLESCGNGLLFDGKGNVHNHCNYHWAVDCGHRKAVLIPEDSGNGCVFKYGIYPEGPYCSTRYIKCAEGVAYPEHCKPGLAYDDRTHSCNWPDLLLDQCNPADVVGFSCPDRIDPHSVSAKFHPFPRFAIPNSCNQLVTCVHGHPRLIQCEEGQLLDQDSLTCEDEEHVNCGGHFGKKKK